MLENCLDRPLNSPNTQTPTCLLSMTQMPSLWSKGQSSHDFLISRVTLTVDSQEQRMQQEEDLDVQLELLWGWVRDRSYTMLNEGH